MIHGLILINKRANITSHDVVAKIRRIYKTQKVGHFGTLDPMAEGLLLIGIGNVTKFFNFYVKKRKVYSGIIKFGYATDTHDKMGKPITEKEEVNLYKTDLDLLKKKFIGSIMQTPPKYSAKKKNGIPLYKYARENIEVKIKPSMVTIYDLKLRIFDKDKLSFLSETSEGTYIRTLAHDMGQELKIGAHLFELKRESIGEFTLKESTDIESLNKEMEISELLKYIQSIETLLPEFPKIILNEEGEMLALNGGAVFDKHIQNILSSLDQFEVFRLFNDSGKLLAMANIMEQQKGFKPFMVFPDQ